MPELPEVETTVRILRQRVLRTSFIDVWCDAENIIKHPFLEFKKKIKGKRINDVKRLGKNILFYLSDNSVLLVHQKMTGHLLYGKDKKEFLKDPMNRFLHVIFFLDNNYQIALSDMRKFAKIELLKEVNLGLGEDALLISLNNFKKAIKRKKGKIKTVLQDQKVIAGIGNIYSDEILYEARIHPLKRADSLKSEELELMYKKMRIVLKKAVKLQGTSFSDYRTPLSEKGKFFNVAKMYHKKKCPCSGEIKKIKVGGRTAHFCPLCQKL